MLLSSFGNISGPLKQLGEQQLAYGKANLDEEGGYGQMPLDQLVSGWGSVGGQGGAQGLFAEMNKQGHDSGFSAQDFGVGWENLMQPLANYYKANPTQAPDVTPNTQNLWDQILNKQAAKYTDANGNLTIDQTAFDNDLHTELQKAGLWHNAGGLGNTLQSMMTDSAFPLLAAPFAGEALFGGGAAGGLESLNGGSFLAANDAAMGTAGFLGSGGYTAAGLGAEALGGGLAGAGLGAAGMSGIESSLSDFGLSSFGGPSASGLGIDSPSNPFSFSGTSDMSFGSPGDSPWGANPRNAQSLIDQGLLRPDWESIPTTNPTTPSPIADTPYDVGQNLVNNPDVFSKSAIQDLVKKYGMDGAKSVYNYIKNQQMSKQAQELGKQASNVMGQPERQPFLNEAQQIAQGNLGQGGEAIKAAVMAQAQARSAKYGYGGTENSRADVMLAQELAKYGNDRLNALLGYTGANQSTSQTAYLASRDSMAFATQSFQGFSALAAKIGMDNSGTVGKAAEEFGSKILSYFA